MLNTMDKHDSVLLLCYYCSIDGKTCFWAMYCAMQAKNTAKVLGKVQLTGKSQELPRKANLKEMTLALI